MPRILWLTIFLLSGCSAFHPWTAPTPPPPPQAQIEEVPDPANEEFQQGLDAMQAGRGTTLLKNVQKHHPNTVFAEAAKRIIDLSTQLQERQEALLVAQGKQRQLSEENQTLSDKARQLQEKIDELSRLLIDLENRAR